MKNNDTYGIIGVRILIKSHNTDFQIYQEYTGYYWKELAKMYLPSFVGKPDTKIQTLHHFTSSIHIQSNIKTNPFNVWLDNPLFVLEDLYYL